MIHTSDKVRRELIAPAAGKGLAIEIPGNAVRVVSGGNPNTLLVFDHGQGEGISNAHAEPASPGATYVRPFRRLYVVQPAAAKLLDADLVLDIHTHGAAVLAADNARGERGAPDLAAVRHQPTHKTGTLAAAGSATLLDYADIDEAPFDRHYGNQWHDTPYQYLDGAVYVDKVTSNLTNTAWGISALTRCSFDTDQGSTLGFEMVFATLVGAVAGGGQDVAFYLGAPNWGYTTSSADATTPGTEVNGRLIVPIGGLKLVLSNGDSVSGAYEALVGFRSR